MKAHALRIGKAMSAALFVLLLVVVGSKNALAQTQVATLQHGEDISAFYGTNAFVEAHDAAETGDIITLSSGTFVPCDITKAITLRGAGCAIDTVTTTNSTIFGGDVNLNVADTDNFLTIEGILFINNVAYGTLNNPLFSKCIFKEINWYNSYGIHNLLNAQFVNCIIEKFVAGYANNTVFINSVIWESGSIGTSHTIVLQNSIFGGLSNGNGDVTGGFSAYNSIIIRDNSYCPTGGSVFVNCIGICTYNQNYPAFAGAYVTNCINYHSYEDVFESFTGEFSFEEPFILKDEIATGFLGNDGTQVGIYGGIMPYSNIPSYMLRTNVSVPNRSNIDGTLNVEIEIIDDNE